MRSILKNTQKYNDITLATGVFLDNTKTKIRFGTIGVSTKTFGHKWFCLPKGKALFKTYDGNNYYEIRKNRIVNEFICRELCKQIGIKVPDIEPATYKNITGLISYDIEDKNKRLYSGEKLFKKVNLYYGSNHINDYVSALNKLKTLGGYNIDIKKEYYNLFKIAVFDTLTMQTDRHINNLYFLIDKKTKEVTVAPLIDNEFAFFGQGLKFIIANGRTDVEKEMMPWFVKFAKYINVYDNNSPFEYNAPERYIASIAYCDLSLKEILKDILNKIEPHSAIENVRKMDFEIPKEYEAYICKIISTTKNEIVRLYNQTIQKKYNEHKNENLKVKGMER